MDDLNLNVENQKGMADGQLPVLADPSLKFWKDNAKTLLGESIKAQRGNNDIGRPSSRTFHG